MIIRVHSVIYSFLNDTVSGSVRVREQESYRGILLGGATNLSSYWIKILDSYSSLKANRDNDFIYKYLNCPALQVDLSCYNNLKQYYRYNHFFSYLKLKFLNKFYKKKDKYYILLIIPRWRKISLEKKIKRLSREEIKETLLNDSEFAFRLIQQDYLISLKVLDSFDIELKETNNYLKLINSFH